VIVMAFSTQPKFEFCFVQKANLTADERGSNGFTKSKWFY